MRTSERHATNTTHPVTSGSLLINLITKQITTIKKTLYSINRKTVSKLSNKKYIRYLLCDNVICDDKSLGSVTRYTRAKAVHSTMSEKELARREAELSDIRVEAVRNQQRRNTHAAVPTVDSAYEGRTKGLPKVSSRSNEFVYVNRAYVGSLNSVNEPRGAHEPITGYVCVGFLLC